MGGKTIGFRINNLHSSYYRYRYCIRWNNAIVIALASRNLPEHQRNKAIFLGTGLAVIVRIVLTILAVYLLTIPYLQLIGGFY